MPGSTAPTRPCWPATSAGRWVASGSTRSTSSGPICPPPGAARPSGCAPSRRHAPVGGRDPSTRFLASHGPRGPGGAPPGKGHRRQAGQRHPGLGQARGRRRAARRRRSEASRPSLVVYHCVDEHSAFPGFVDPQVVRGYDDELTRRADLVITTSENLRAARLPLNPHTHTVLNAADVEIFNRALEPELPLPADLAAIPEPRLGVVGLHDSRLDVDALEALAQADAALAGGAHRSGQAGPGGRGPAASLSQHPSSGREAAAGAAGLSQGHGRRPRSRTGPTS